jgi:GNAT superfamily N-acetyltransferase
MDLLEFLIILENELAEEQKQGVRVLEKQCFSDVDPKEAEECFYAEKFARILAYHSNELVGSMILHKRIIEFDGRTVLVGGPVGVCVKEHMRKKGIGSKMMKKALEVLKEHNCDVACLNADPVDRNEAYDLYKKLGFRLMNRKVSFETSQGNIRYDQGTMFKPLRSKELYNHIMNSNKTFHYGKGYW